MLSENDSGKITGLFAFVMYPQIFTGELTANELMWYVEPESRKGEMGCGSYGQRKISPKN